MRESLLVKNLLLIKLMDMLQKTPMMVTKDLPMESGQMKMVIESTESPNELLNGNDGELL